MRAIAWLVSSTFTDEYFQFQKSQKANFSYVVLLVCFIYLMQKIVILFYGRLVNHQSCYFFMQKHNLGQF